jgi:hypothetical protein
VGAEMSSVDSVIRVAVDTFSQCAKGLAEANTWLSPLGSVFNIASGLVILYLTYLVLRFTAKPRLRVSFADGGHASHYLYAGETVRSHILLENRGYWYAQPAATNLLVYINVPRSFEPIRLRFGSGLELETGDVRPGKGKTKYLLARGINLFAHEPGERMEIEVRLPQRGGSYRYRIAIHTDRGDDCGVYFLRLRVRKPPSRRRDLV